MRRGGERNGEPTNGGALTMTEREKLYAEYSTGRLSFEDFCERLDELNLLERQVA